MMLLEVLIFITDSCQDNGTISANTQDIEGNETYLDSSEYLRK